MASPLLPRPRSLGASIGQGGVLWRSSSVADGLGGQSPAPSPLIPDGKRRVGGGRTLVQLLGGEWPRRPAPRSLFLDP